MNRSKAHIRIWLMLVSGMLILLLTALPAAAAGDGAAWRPIYDLVMRWVNFGILAFVIVKYGRAPLMTFLKGQQTEVANEINQVETRKDILLQQIRETVIKTDESSRRFEKIKARIIEEGERERARIIDNARELSKNMIEIEKTKAQNRIISARNSFMAEMVDAALEFARQRLPSELTHTDQQKMLDTYLADVRKMSG